MNRLKTAEKIMAKMHRLRAAAKTARGDVEKAILDDTASPEDLRAFGILQTLLRGTEFSNPEKLANYKRDITTAENALRQANTDRDEEAYNHAMFVLEWAIKGRGRLV